MAASRKRRSASAPLVDAAAAVLAALPLRGERLAVGLSGGVDSVVLLHLLHRLAPQLGYELSALHVNHGLSPNAGAWQRSCAALCRALGVPFTAVRVKVRKGGHGPEAAAREARRAAFAKARVDALALAHQLDDQAETVLHNLLRGAGAAGASGMPVAGRVGDKLVLRPLLGVPRSAVLAYARAHRLAFVEDESNADESLTRNYLRRRVGPVIEARFPRWKESLARAARHFAAAGLTGQALLRSWLSEQGLRAPSEARLGEMLKQLGGKGARTAIAHDGAVVRAYRGKAYVTRGGQLPPFRPRAWKGEAQLALPELGGELRCRKVRSKGIASALLAGKSLEVRLRSGGERLQPDPKRPRRTLKNLFQEAGIPPWERDRLPLLFCGDELVWVPGLGVDAKFLSAGGAPGLLPDWRLSSRPS
jgi:tRNA(Ile)-lysidine synthase